MEVIENNKVTVNKALKLYLTNNDLVPWTNLKPALHSVHQVNLGPHTIATAEVKVGQAQHNTSNHFLLDLTSTPSDSLKVTYKLIEKSCPSQQKNTSLTSIYVVCHSYDIAVNTCTLMRPNVIVQLPKKCFLDNQMLQRIRIVNLKDQTNLSAVYELILDTDFEKAHQETNVTIPMTLVYSNQPTTNHLYTELCEPTGPFQTNFVQTGNFRSNFKNWFKKINNISKKNKHNIHTEKKFECSPSIRNVSMDFEGIFKSDIQFSVYVEATLVPPKLETLYSYLNAEVDLDLSAKILSNINFGDKSFNMNRLRIALTPFEIPGVITVGPELSMNMILDLKGCLDIDMDGDLKTRLASVSLGYGKKDDENLDALDLYSDKNDSNITYSFKKRGIQVHSAGTEASSLLEGRIDAHLIPKMGLNIDILNGKWVKGLSLEIDFDMSLDASVQRYIKKSLEIKENKKNRTVSGINGTASVDVQADLISDPAVILGKSGKHLFTKNLWHGDYNRHRDF